MDQKNKMVIDIRRILEQLSIEKGKFQDHHDGPPIGFISTTAQPSQKQ